MVKANLPSAASVKSFYERNKANFVVPARRDVHLVKAARQEDAIKAKQALQGGASWASVRRRYSERVLNHGNANGSLLMVRRGDAPPAFNQAVFSAPLDAIRGPVEDPPFWYLFEVKRSVSPIQLPFARVRPTIVKELQNATATQAQNVFTNRMRKKYRPRTTCEPSLKIILCKNVSPEEAQ